MLISESRNGDTYILHLSGKLDAIISTALREKLVAAIDQGDRSILLDCENLEHVSAPGLRVLFEAACNPDRHPGRLKFCAVNSTVRKIFDRVDLTSEVTILATLEEALR
ncbi:MAG: STAS domain-containing protein [Syntrophobacteraceae bacterium]